MSSIKKAVSEGRISAAGFRSTAWQWELSIEVFMTIATAVNLNLKSNKNPVYLSGEMCPMLISGWRDNNCRHLLRDVLAGSRGRLPGRPC